MLWFCGLLSGYSVNELSTILLKLTLLSDGPRPYPQMGRLKGGAEFLPGPVLPVLGWVPLRGAMQAERRIFTLSVINFWHWARQPLRQRLTADKLPFSCGHCGL
jgi:hypothetical protein